MTPATLTGDTEMTAKIEKAARVTANILKKKPDMTPDFAEAMGLLMVLTGDYSIKRNRMKVFLAGEKGAARFRKQLEEQS
jgi:hypothetical protein